MLPADFAVQRIHAHGFGVGLGRAVALDVAEHPQPAYTQRLAVGEGTARHADIPRTDAVGILIIAAGAFAGDILAQRPGLAVKTGFHGIARNLQARLDMPRFAVIAVAVGREVHDEFFIGHVDLNRADIIITA